MKRLGLIAGLIISTLLAGCAVAQTDPDPAEGALTIENLYAPQAGDEALKQGIVYMESAQWDEAAQTLTVSGTLPNPCCQLRATIDQNGQRIDLNIYSITEPDVICAQMLQPFEASFEMKSFNPQTFRVFINGQETQL
jgi:hypothetical protein